MLTWQHEHVAAPTGLTQTHVGAQANDKWAKRNGPIGIVGPIIEYRRVGHHKAHRVTQ